MKFPVIKIEWSESARVPITVKVSKLSNGFLIGNTFFASEDLLVKHLAEYVKDPYAYVAPPEYKD